MGSLRWAKLAGDLRAERGRVALMVAAIAVSLTGVGAVLGGYAVLTREIAASYLGTRPAAATLELPGGAGAEVVEAARRLPGVTAAEAREVVPVRARVGGAWRRLLLFVIDDFGALQLNRFRPERGAWPPPEGTMLVERSALGMLEVELGGVVQVKTANGTARGVAVSGVVHDPGLAPAWQERSGYGYVTRATLAGLGVPPVLHELRLSFGPATAPSPVVEAQAAEVARQLVASGHPVQQLQVPPPGQHPHQRQMVAILVMLLTFAAMALVLSAILVASSLAALLARQVREIGVMKAIGATTGAIAALYAALVGLVGLSALALAAPLGALGARGLAGAVSRLLNFDLASTAIPAWVFVVQAAAGLGVPLLVSASPIGRASRRTVRQALDDHGVPAGPTPAAIARLPIPVRYLFGRPARLALTLGLLASGVAMALTALQVKLGWEANVAKVYQTRSYDTEIVLDAPAPVALAARVGGLPGVRSAEGWGYAPAAFSREGGLDVVRTYPDRGHGSLVAMGIPPETTLVNFPLLAGRWLRPGDRGGDAVVLNHSAAAQAPGLRVGDVVRLGIDGHPSRWRLVGIVEEIGAAGVAYVADTSFAEATATTGRARLLRVVTGAAAAAARAATADRIDEALAAAGAPVQAVLPLAELRTAMGDHVLVLVRMLMAMATILGVVGALGLASAMGIGVVERTRELAVMKTLGATPSRLRGLLLLEGMSVAAASGLVGLALSIPLTLLVDEIVGRLGFLAPLPLVFSWGGALSALAIGGVVTLVATLIPARRAAGLVIREALERT